MSDDHWLTAQAPGEHEQATVLGVASNALAAFLAGVGFWLGWLPAIAMLLGGCACTLTRIACLYPC